MFKNLTVGKRLGLGFGSVLLLLAIIAWVSILQVAGMNLLQSDGHADAGAGHG
jgi:CHASE3 domain sensor protein